MAEGLRYKRKYIAKWLNDSAMWRNDIAKWLNGSAKGGMTSLSSGRA
ncbi:MAG: hypothetical protein V1871_00500 [Planctomycetota bacterium]